MPRRTRILSMRDRLAILQMYKDGLYNQKELAKMYGVSQPRISQILNDEELKEELNGFYSTNTISARTRALIERDGFDNVLEFYQNRDASITQEDVQSWASGESIPQIPNIARSIARRGLSLNRSSGCD